MSTGSHPLSDSGPPEREGLVGPLVTGREPRHIEPRAPAERVGPFRVGAASEPAAERDEPFRVGASSEPATERDAPIRVGATSEPAAERDEPFRVAASSEPAAERDAPFRVGAASDPAAEHDAPFQVGASSEPPAGRPAHFRVGASSEPPVERILSVGEQLSSPGDGGDAPRPHSVHRPAPAPKLPETVPAFGAIDLPDPWDSHHASGGRPRPGAGPKDPGGAPTAGGEHAAADAAETPRPSLSPRPELPRLVGDPGRSEEVADRLESIARVIRERGPAGALTDLPDDPLAAMVAGYLLGFSSGGPAATRTPAG